jgi:hypothetical protein
MIQLFYKAIGISVFKNIEPVAMHHCQTTAANRANRARPRRYSRIFKTGHPAKMKFKEIGGPFRCERVFRGKESGFLFFVYILSYEMDGK